MPAGLLITVGTGDGVENAIFNSIKKADPDFVQFLVTKVSKDKTLPRVLNLLDESSITKSYDVINVSDENDFQECAQDCIRAIKQLCEKGHEPSEIEIDFTSGTKAMSAGAVVAGLEVEVGDLGYIAGKRGPDGRVATGTEKRITLDPVEIKCRRKLGEAVGLFNSMRYEGCIELLESIKKSLMTQSFTETVDLLLKLSRAYRSWDLFAHKDASEFFDEIHGEKERLERWGISEGYNRHRYYIKNILSEDYNVHKVSDLWNNAKRRAEEGRYDDAVGRLYRLLEYAAQCRLFNEYAIKTSNVDIEKTPGSVRGEYERLRAENDGRIRIGLEQGYQLLEQLGDPAGKFFRNDKELVTALRMRNDSLLAHGLTSIDQDKYQRMQDAVAGLMEEIEPSWKKEIKRGEFFKLNESGVLGDLLN